MSEVQPFLRWVGSKIQSLPYLQARMPTCYGRYFEPFVGSGALFFAEGPKRARLSDSNPELITTYLALRDRTDEVIERLAEHAAEHSLEHYLHVRKDVMCTGVELAARVIYLNRTCFNGLYRVNSRGEFNVPIGKNGKGELTPADVICNRVVLEACARALADTEIVCDDFANVLAHADTGDCVYLDPPYPGTLRVASNATFAYTAEGFAEPEHRRLASMVHVLTARGVFVMMSINEHPLAHELYARRNWSPPLCRDVVRVRRRVSARLKGRRVVSEVIVRNYGVPDARVSTVLAQMSRA